MKSKENWVMAYILSRGHGNIYAQYLKYYQQIWYPDDIESISKLGTTSWRHGALIGFV